MILAGRRLNDNMGSYVVNQVSKLMIKKCIQIVDANVLIMGLTFKENCPDLRNSRVVDLVTEFESLSCNVEVYDPWVNKKEANELYGISIVSKPLNGKYDAIVLAVGHNEFTKMSASQLRKLGRKSHVLYDVKYVLNVDEADGRL